MRPLRLLIFSALVALARAQSGPAISRLVNLSVETKINAAGSALTVGLYIAGTDLKVLLVRGIGPTLGAFGMTDALTTPRLRLFDSSGALLTTVTSWSGDPALAQAFMETGAFALSTGSADAALLSSLIPGAYTAQVDGGGYNTGNVLLEFYDADAVETFSHLANLSAKAVVRSGSPLTAGFVISGTTGESILLRAVGPALFDFGIRGYLTRPRLVLFDSTGAAVMANAGWGDDPALAQAFTDIGAFALTAGSADAAMLLFLAPGRYTAQVTGADEGSGLAMIEIYEVPSAAIGSPS